jgi:exonuclease III
MNDIITVCLSDYSDHTMMMNIPTIVSQRKPWKNLSTKSPFSTRNNLINIPLEITPLPASQGSRPNVSKEFAPSLLLSNVMSLVPKIDEVRLYVSKHNPDLVFITETWLKESIGDNHVDLPGYNIKRRDRSVAQHGGVCFFSKECIKVIQLHQFHDPNFEVLWTQIRPPRLPRGFPCLVAATVYHPPCANDNDMLEYLSKSLTDIEGLFPGCGIIIAGDFNHLNIKNLSRQFQLKQLVHLPTRGTNTLDLILTNMHSFYEPNSAISHPPFGLSDHCVILLYPKQRESTSNTKKIVYKRDTRPSRKQMLGNFLNQIDWHFLDWLTSCNEKNDLFTGIITTGLNYIMPEKKSPSTVMTHHGSPKISSA